MYNDNIIVDNKNIEKKKRGRKSKIKTIIEEEQKDNQLDRSEDENIILHLPINIEDINYSKMSDKIITLFNNGNKNNKNNKEKSGSKVKNDYGKVKDDYGKVNDDYGNNDSDNSKNDNEIFSSDEDINNSLSRKNRSENTNSISKNISYLNDIISTKHDFSTNKKCWWCKNYFESLRLELPEYYFNNTFYCIGNFCSFNCVKSYNIDINDTLIYKRESLINLMYYNFMKDFCVIKPAPHWLCLEEYGGTITIEEFRKSSITIDNTINYILIKPPIVSRQMQIEESYNNNNTATNSIVTQPEYVIKRNKSENTIKSMFG